MTRHASATGLITAVITLVIVTALPALAVPPDNKPPKLRVAIKPSFVVGSVISAAKAFDEDPQDGYTNGIEQAMSWSATDNVGVCSYDLFRVYAGLPPDPVFEYSQTTKYTDSADDYDGSFGGGSLELTGWSATARDCEGNSVTKRIHMSPTVTQEDNANAGHPVAGTFSYARKWTTTTCDCFSAGQTRRTTKAGAKARFTRTYGKGDHVAIVMALGPNRGRASILVDGKQVAVVDTFAPENTNRVVVFERRMSAGKHKLTIVNLASSERPRIDVDAILTN